MMTKRIGKGLLVLGVSAVAVAAASAWIPFLRIATNHMSVSTAHGLCSSSDGVLVGGTLNCTAVSTGYWCAVTVGLAGLALVVAGIIRAITERSEIKYRRLLTPAPLRLFALFAITGIFVFWGYTLLSSSGNISPVEEGTLTPEPLTVSLWSDHNNLHAVITKVLLKKSSLSIDLHVAAPENSKASEKMEIKLLDSGVSFGGWSRTFDVPPGSSSQNFDVPFASCYCYEYRSPYLFATGLSVDNSYANSRTQPFLNLFGVPPGWNEVAPVIKQEILDFSKTGIGGGVFNLSTSAFPSTQQIGLAEWRWQNINPSDSVSFTAESVSGKDDADNKVFQAGIFLGFAGAAFILVVDHGFDIWSESRKRKEEQENKHVADLERLAALHASGSLDEDEFRAAKARILGG